MKLHSIWFLALLLTTSVCLPINGNAAEVSVYSAEQNTHIRSLAASCAACHGTLGNAVGSSVDNSIAEGNAVLAGMASADFTAKMLGFRDGSRTSTVMHHHARGLTLDEINQLSVHFSQQKRIVSTSLKSQILKVSHE